MVQVTRRDFRSAVIGMVLGDGNISKFDTVKLMHCERQRDYLDWKRSILQTRQQADLQIKPHNNNGYPAFRLETRKRPLYRILRKKMYPSGEKRVSRKMLDYLTPIGLAIWFQDDGSLSAKKRNGKIHSYEITLNTYWSKEDCETAITYFKDVWQVKWGLSKSKGKYRLRMGTIEGRKFARIISQYIVDCMRYKIDPLLSERPAPSRW